MVALMLLTPLAVLATLWVAGLGLADLLGCRLPREARAALAPLCTAAMLLISSPLVLAGVSPLALALAVLAALTAYTVIRGRRVAAALRRAAWPATVSLVALVLAAAPALRHGTWVAATFGNQDPYVWVSQARALTDRPADGPAGTTPDRVSYDLLSKEHWPTGLPVTLAELAAVEDVDPVEAYGVFAAVISALLAAAVFFCARGSLRWPAGRSAAAAVAVAANGLMLLSAFYGLQAQLLLTVVGTLMVFTLPLCLERRARRRELVVPALFAAACFAAYGWLSLAFVGIAAVVACACRPSRAAGEEAWRRFFGRLAAVVGVGGLLGLVNIVRVAQVFAGGHRQESPVARHFQARYAWAFPSDSLGLVPRYPPWSTPGSGWSTLSLAAAAMLLVLGVARVRSARSPRGRILVAAAATAVVALAGFAVSGSSPYMSFKLMAYATPLFTLLVLASLAPRRAAPASATAARRAIAAVSSAGLVAVVATFATLFAITTASMMWRGVTQIRLATADDTLVAAAKRLPTGSVIRLDVADAWEQVWLVYFLRDRPLSVRDPAVVFTGFSAADAAKHRRFDAKASYAIGPPAGRSAIWRGRDAAIYALRGNRRAATHGG